MFKFLFKKEHQVQELMHQYLEALRMVQESFCDAFDVCLMEGLCDEFDFLTGQAHKFESKADDIREEIKTLMYGKALIPESRGDIMGLLESLDEIPRVLELILRMVHTQKLALPDFIRADLKELVDISLDSCHTLYKQVENLLRDNTGIRPLVAAIDQNESHCDHIERRTICKIFDSDIDPFQKLQLKELVITIGEISDQADRVSKRVNIISMKRRV